MEINTEDLGDTKKAANFETLPFPHFLLKNLKILNLVVWQKSRVGTKLIELYYL